MRLARILDKNNQVVYAAEQKDGRVLKIEGDIAGGENRVTDEAVEPGHWLPPLDPTAILCIGLNYRKHAEEGGAAVPEYPVLFMKNPASATGHREPIELPAVCKEEVDYEAELAVVIGKPACNVKREDALNHVLGYMCGNDVSARIWQSKLGGSQWCRGKGFDTFAPLGPVLVTRDELTDPNALAIKSMLNGEVMQSSNTKDMIFDVPALISFLSEDTTLLPGTVIMTGTPEGVGWARDPKVVLKPGDTIAIEIEGLGRLENPVVA